MQKNKRVKQLLKKKRQRFFLGFFVKQRKKKLHPFLLSTVFALFIGILFGVVMLQMIKQSNENSVLEMMQPTEQVNVESTDTTAQMYEAKITIYTLQLGVFTAKQNAEQMIHSLQDEIVSSFLWERDDYFYVLSSIFLTETEAREQLPIYEGMGIEAYVKEWETALNDSFSESERLFLTDFQSIWTSSLTTFLQSGNVEESKWEQLLHTHENTSSRIKPLKERIEKLLRQINDKDIKPEEIEQFFIEILYSVETI